MGSPRTGNNSGLGLMISVPCTYKVIIYLCDRNVTNSLLQFHISAKQEVNTDREESDESIKTGTAYCSPADLESRGLGCRRPYKLAEGTRYPTSNRQMKVSQISKGSRNLEITELCYWSHYESNYVRGCMIQGFQLSILSRG